jgi:hypothetical protein
MVSPWAIGALAVNVNVRAVAAPAWEVDSTSEDEKALMQCTTLDDEVIGVDVMLAAMALSVSATVRDSISAACTMLGVVKLDAVPNTIVVAVLAGTSADPTIKSIVAVACQTSPAARHSASLVV